MNKWFLSDYVETAAKEAYTIVITTDAPCHLWLRWSLNPPQRHARSRKLRGVWLEGDVYYCFTAYHNLEQDEAGDTLTHTFTLSPWPSCETRWFYFHGTVSGAASPSTSPIFGRHLFFTSHTLRYIVSHPNDEVVHYGPTTFTCPSFCPPWHAAGRQMIPGPKIGSGLIFRSLTIPKAAEITEAYFELTAFQNIVTLAIKTRISVEDTSNPDDWYGADTLELFTRWGNRAGIVNWDDFPPWVKDSVYSSPSLIAPVQHLVSRADWVSGNPASFFWEDFDQRTAWAAWKFRSAYSYTNTPALAPVLRVTYNLWHIEEIT